jgi:hypothetical protein
MEEEEGARGEEHTLALRARTHTGTRSSAHYVCLLLPLLLPLRDVPRREAYCDGTHKTMGAKVWYP